MIVDYPTVLQMGWKTGVHDVRGHKWQHPWLAVYRPSQHVCGCNSRAEARAAMQYARRHNSLDGWKGRQPAPASG